MQDIAVFLLDHAVPTALLTVSLGVLLWVLVRTLEPMLHIVLRITAVLATFVLVYLMVTGCEWLLASIEPDWTRTAFVYVATPLGEFSLVKVAVAAFIATH